MSSYTLTAKSMLNLPSLTINETKLSEIMGRSLVSISTPKDGYKLLAEALKSNLKVNIPAIGKSETSVDGKYCLLGLQADQIFAQVEEDGPRVAMQIASKLEGKAYCTDQSDSWVSLRLEGMQARDVLERICMLNMHSDIFLERMVARTSMEHIGVILLRESVDSYQLMAMRSFGKSLWHALELSLRNL